MHALGASLSLPLSNTKGLPLLQLDPIPSWLCFAEALNKSDASLWRLGLIHTCQSLLPAPATHAHAENGLFPWEHGFCASTP